MPRMRSTISDDFFKALEGDYKAGKLDSEVVKKAYPVMDSDGIEAIENLYNLDTSGDAYDVNIVEVAHPNAVIIHPSYDKVNGLFENINERSTVMQNLALDMPTGSVLARTKYASKELTLELVKIANEMESHNKEDLFTLADKCLMSVSTIDDRLTKKAGFKKESLGPLILGVGLSTWALGAAAVLGGVWLYSHLDDADNGFIANCDNAIKQLQDLQENSWYESDIDESVQKSCEELVLNLSQMKDQAAIFATWSNKFEAPRNLEETKIELEKLKKDKAVGAKDAPKAGIDMFKALVQKTYPMVNTAIRNFSNEAYQKDHTNNSWLGNAAGRVGDWLHGRWGLIANDFQSALNALMPLKKSMEDTMKRVFSVDQMIEKYESDIIKAEGLGKETPSTPGASPSSSAPATTDSSGKPKKSITEELADHAKEMGSFFNQKAVQ